MHRVSSLSMKCLQARCFSIKNRGALKKVIDIRKIIFCSGMQENYYALLLQEKTIKQKHGFSGAKAVNPFTAVIYECS